MKRSDGATAVGIGECISIAGFSPECKTRVGDKVILYTNYPMDHEMWEKWKVDHMAVSGPELCTWGKLGVHYRLAYEFPDEHKRRQDIIQDARDVY